MELTIRPVTREELPETVRIYLECLRDDYSYKPKAYIEASSLEEELAECVEWMEAPDQPNQIFAAFEGPVMAGYIAVGPNTGEPQDYDGEVTGFFVRRAYRRRGLGLRLLQTGLRYLLELGYRRVVIYNHHIAESNSYYRYLGGEVVYRVCQSPGGMELEVDVFGWEIDRFLDIVTERVASSLDPGPDPASSTGPPTRTSKNQSVEDFRPRPRD
jgi:GNAT superfamily N-acetyltransferase